MSPKLIPYGAASLMLVVALFTTSADAFATTTSAPPKLFGITTRRSDTRRAMMTLPMDADFFKTVIQSKESLSLASPIVESLPSLMTSSLDTALHDPNVNAEILGDMSHVSLDLFTLLGPVGLELKAATVIGRLFAMAADYVPDHKILPEEFVYQISMLTMACSGFIKSLTNLVASKTTKATVQDGKAYKYLFAPSGITWSQFKLATKALDWVTIKEGDDDVPHTEDTDYVYWLYSGHVRVEDVNSGEILFDIDQTPTTTSSSAAAGRALLGECRLLRDDDYCMPDSDEEENRSLRAMSSTSAKLLRIHVPTIKTIMANDKQFASSIRNMLLNGMKAKMMNMDNAQLLATSATTASAASFPQEA